MKLLLIMACLGLVACDPNCEERGGTVVRDGTYTLYNRIGNLTLPTTYTKWKCVEPQQ